MPFTYIYSFFFSGNVTAVIDLARKAWRLSLKWLEMRQTVATCWTVLFSDSYVKQRSMLTVWSNWNSLLVQVWPTTCILFFSLTLLLLPTLPFQNYVPFEKKWSFLRKFFLLYDNHITWLYNLIMRGFSLQPLYQSILSCKLQILCSFFILWNKFIAAVMPLKLLFVMQKQQHQNIWHYYYLKC